MGIAIASEITVEPSGIEAQSNLDHQPPRKTFRKLKLDFQDAGDTKLLAISVKGMHDKLGPDVCVPSKPVFRVYPSLNIFGKGISPKETLEVLARVDEASGKEVEQEMEKVGFKRAIKNWAPSAADVPFDDGDTVIVLREKQFNNSIGDFLGPFTAYYVDNRRQVVYVKDANFGPAHPIGSAQGKRYLRPE